MYYRFKKFLHKKIIEIASLFFESTSETSRNLRELKNGVKINQYSSILRVKYKSHLQFFNLHATSYRRKIDFIEMKLIADLQILFCSSISRKINMIYHYNIIFMIRNVIIIAIS